MIGAQKIQSKLSLKDSKELGLVLKDTGVPYFPCSPSFITDAVHLSGITAPHERDTLEYTTQFILRTFSTDTFGPLLFTQALLPLVLLSPHPHIVLMSSRVGGSADKSSGGSYAYRTSKAALNSIEICKAMDLKRSASCRTDAPLICQDRV